MEEIKHRIENRDKKIQQLIDNLDEECPYKNDCKIKEKGLQDHCILIKRKLYNLLCEE